MFVTVVTVALPAHIYERMGNNGLSKKVGMGGMHEWALPRKNTV